MCLIGGLAFSAFLQPNLTIIGNQVEDAVIWHHTLAPLFFSGVISTVRCCLHTQTGPAIRYYTVNIHQVNAACL